MSDNYPLIPAEAKQQMPRQTRPGQHDEENDEQRSRDAARPRVTLYEPEQPPSRRERQHEKRKNAPCDQIRIARQGVLNRRPDDRYQKNGEKQTKSGRKLRHFSLERSPGQGSGRGTGPHIHPISALLLRANHSGQASAGGASSNPADLRGLACAWRRCARFRTSLRVRAPIRLSAPEVRRTSAAFTQPPPAAARAATSPSAGRAWPCGCPPWPPP